ncbi:conserved protein of unknown function [Magnetospirillum sp. XM-1]|uniref:hypothetical protein n=1 Tax=Magnetospirillum sp. XM-1 TaxID=1663591 RepID=UPI00073DF085|nr:hypothetical protein [Magnetospirillum sp. XM-1]CUW37864.1 conserved protein of unknown function [Magnetospirillum sp. XM-1]
MSDEQKAPQAPVGRRYKEWEHTSAEEVAFSRKVFYGMMTLLAILLGALVYGALR